ncbi:MAG: DUF371 domain-containing protein [Nitrosopumilales archaeon]|jgi:hypothetical protein|nr:DUF371 domain-containing protein [Nitrosopumilales archaeon]
MVQDEIIFYGHPNVRSTHKKTIEITKAPTLSLRGDCIIGVNANKACRDLKPTLKRLLQQADLVVKIEIEVSDLSFAIDARSNSRLSLLNHHDIVIRKSDFVCPRTVAITCNKASSDIPSDIVQLLGKPEMQGLLRIRIE